MKVLVTGSAGFIGSATCINLLQRGDEVIGIDNHNNYYDPALKEAKKQTKIAQQVVAGLKTVNTTITDNEGVLIA